MGGDSLNNGKGSSSFLATFSLMLNNTIGAGLLALPYTFKRSSLIIGAIAMLITCLLNYSAMILIARSCELCGATSYTDLATAALGKRASTLIAAVLSIYTLGSCASYVVLLGDALPEIAQLVGLGNSIFGTSGFLLAISSLLFLMPLSSMRNLKSLRFTAICALVCILYTAGLIAIRASSNPRNPTVIMIREDDGLFIGIPVTMVSFTMHYNTPRLFFELENQSTSKMALIGAASFGSALILYELTAYCGYSLFGINTMSDILENFDANDIAANVARVGLAIVMIVSFPIVLNALRAAFSSLLPESWQKQIENGDSKEGLVDDNDDDELHIKSIGFVGFVRSLVNDWAFLLLTFILVTFSLGTALAIPNLGLILGYKGALGGTLIVYILPAIFYYILVSRMKIIKNYTQNSIMSRTSSYGSLSSISSPFLSPQLDNIPDTQQSSSIETPLISFSPTSVKHTPLDWDGSNQSPMTILGIKTPRNNDIDLSVPIQSQYVGLDTVGTRNILSFEGCVAIFYTLWGFSVMILGVLTTAGILT